MSEFKALGVTIKAPESDRYAGDNPWFVFEGTPVEVAQNVIQTFGLTDVSPEASVAEVVLAAQTTVTAIANAVRGTAAPAPRALASGSSFGGGDRGLAPEPQQQPAGWGNSPQQSAPQWSGAQQGGQQQGGGGGRPQAQQHPEGTACDACGTVLERKTTSTGKVTWRCPSWRWNNGSPNEHTQLWA